MASTSVVYDILARDRASDKFDHLGRSIGGTQTKMAVFTGFMQGVGQAAARGLGVGIRVGARALVDMTKNAVEDEAAQRKLALALQNATGATDDQIASVEDWISAQGVALGVTDDELRPAFQRLVESTGSIKEAQRQMAVAFDVSAGKGKSLETVTAALERANNGSTAGLTRLGVKMKDVDGNALSLDQALQQMSQTFGGQAAAKAGTFEGKMGRLKLIFDETKEAIGARLIPVITSLADWVLTKAVPAVDKFTQEWKRGIGTGGQVRDVLERVKNAVVDVTKFLVKHKETVAALIGVYVGYKAAVLGIVAAQKVAAVAVGVYTVATKAASAATKAWAAVQWLLNAALTANPIGLVVVGVAALAAGIVIAYKKSETFRSGVQKVWEWLKKLVGLTPLGSIISNVQSAISFVTTLIDKVKELVSWVGQLDLGKLKSFAAAIPGLGGLAALPRMAQESGKNAGDAWLSGFTKALGGGRLRQAWRDFINGLMTDALTGMRSAIADLRERRNEFANFSGFRQNLFGADISGAVGATTTRDAEGNEVTTPGPTGIAALRAFAATQRQNAQQLADDVARLTAMGISQDLLDDLKSQGASGLAQIHALATASQEDFAAIMADMAEVNRLNQIAGNQAAASRDQAIEQMGRVIADMPRALAAAPLVIELHTTQPDGRTIVRRIHAEERAANKKYLVDA